MTDDKPTRKALLRPLHLLGIAAGSAVFAAIVTLVSTGAFTDRVNDLIAQGRYNGLPPVLLGLVVGGITFIVVLLLLSMLILAVDPADVTRRVDGPVLYDPEPTPDAAPTSESGEEPSAG